LLYESDAEEWTLATLLARRQQAHLQQFELVPVQEKKVVRLSHCKVHIYKPAKAGPLPVIIAYHGGGFYFDFVPLAESYYRHLANETGWMVIAPDYRVAPEHPYPAAVDDCYETYKWILQQGARVGADTSRVIVWGDSAGGNLAAVVTQRARQEGLNQIDHQILIYPAVDISSDHTPSFQRFKSGYLFTDAMMRFIRKSYAGKVDSRHPELSPLLNPDFRGLPPCLLITAEFDPFHDQGVEYIRKLAKLGIPVQHKEFYGVMHGFAGIRDIFPDENHELLTVVKKTLRQLEEQPGAHPAPPGWRGDRPLLAGEAASK